MLYLTHQLIPIMKKKITLGLFLFLLFCCVLIFRPVPIVAENQAVVVSGVVEKMKLTEGNDFVFQLKDNPVRYYINRGVEVGLDYENFEKNLLGKEVVFKYPRYWTPLDWNNSIRHISKVEHQNEVYFNELNP